MKTRLIRASALPSTFEIQTTYHERVTGYALRVGDRVRVHTTLGAYVFLRPSQRVRVVVRG